MSDRKVVFSAVSLLGVSLGAIHADPHPAPAAKKVSRLFVAFAMSLVPSVAIADTSCDKLFGRLRQVAAASQQNDVHVLWTTNYFVPDRDARFVATTQISLRPQGKDLFGSAIRGQTVFSRDPAKSTFRRSDNVSLRIRRDGKITFNDMYGPYDPACSHDKFAVVNGGNSIEVFSFDPRVKGEDQQTTANKAKTADKAYTAMDNYLKQ